MIDNPAFRWASFTYVSRQPLAFWLFGLGAIAVGSPLLGARLVMLLANIPSFFLLFLCTKKLMNERAGLYAAAIFTCTPLFILLSSLALMDGFLLTISMIILWLFMCDWKEKSPYHLVGISILLGVSLWIKTTALLLFVLSFIGLFWKIKKLNLFNIFLLVTIPVLIVLPMWFQKDVMNMFREPGNFTFTATEFVQLPIHSWAKNLFGALFSILIYFNPFLLLALIHAKKLIRRNYGALLLAWILVPTVAIILIGKNFQVRYFAFGLIALIPLLSLKKQNTVFFVFVLFMYAIFFIIKPVQFFSLFPIQSQERDYALSWPSGYGLPELIKWIDDHQPMTIVVADSPGNPGDYLLATYYYSTQVQILIHAIHSPIELKKLKPIVDKQPLFIATRSTLIPPEMSSYLQPIKLFTKPYSTETIGIYRINL
jgi:4-amino-4-deoxy-L-arabinose transferase-like glycosyltransferase